MKPLHYKVIVTKKRLHRVFLSAFLFFTMKLTAVFIFFRQDKFLLTGECIALYILQDLPYILFILVFFIIVSVIMLTSYVIITVKLSQRNKEQSNTINSKVTKASWLALSAFVILYYPSLLLSFATNFFAEPYPVFLLVLLDASFLLYYFNNVINPFIYFATLVNFKVGYKALLTCKNIDTGQVINSTSSIRSISTYNTRNSTIEI